MIRMFFATPRRLAITVIAVAAITGCAGFGGAESTPEASVRARASQRWQDLIAGKWDSAYRLLSPGYRAVTSVETYKGGLSVAVTWEAAEVVIVNCDSADACTAKIRLESKPNLPSMKGRGNIVTFFDENWVRADGQWWHFPNR